LIGFGLAKKHYTRLERFARDKNSSFLTFVKTLTHGANVIKHFNVVIYCHFTVILSFCVIKPYYLGNYCGMAVNYHSICETNVIKHNLT
jgi:hypothetical protein